MAIRKTNIGSSEPIKIPLKNPKDKYGRTFDIVSVFAEAAVTQPELVLERDETNEKLYSQEIVNNDITITWNVSEPKDGNIIKNKSLIEKNQYISGFNVFTYQRTEEEVSNPKIEGGILIDSALGIKENQYRITASGANQRYLNFTVVISDVFGNKSTGHLFTYNPEPSGIITSQIKSGGRYYVDYSGSRDLEGINMYLFTGTNSYGMLEDNDEFKSSHKIKTVNYNRSGFMPLMPDRDCYLMAYPFDNLGEGAAIPIASQTQNPLKPSGTNFKPSIRGFSEVKKDAGSYSLITLDYDWKDHEVVDLYYNVYGTGGLSYAVSGYQDLIYLDYGLITDTIGTETEISDSFKFDHKYKFVNETNTGELIIEDNKIYGSGAGNYFKNNEVLYSGNNDVYEYAYYDVDLNKICFHSLSEIESGECYVNGTFSQEIDNPNDNNVKFRFGEKFTGKYEMASSYLNQIGEMPAVILNKTQLNHINLNKGAKGWVGLRRKNVGIFKDLFENNSENLSAFQTLNPQQHESGKIFLAKNQSIEYHNNNVGEDWAWVNSSGTHVYRKLGQNFNRDDSIVVKGMFILKESQKQVGSYSRTHVFQKPKLKNIGASFIDSELTCSYDWERSFFRENSENLDVTFIDLHTGEYSSFAPDENNFCKRFDPNQGLRSYQSYVEEMHGPEGGYGRVVYNLDEQFSGYINLVTYDNAGSGVSNSLEEKVVQLTVQQQTIYPLDDAHFQNLTSVNVGFDKYHKFNPDVNFNIQYKGEQAPVFLNGMIIGEPTVSGCEILLSQVPPSTGYLLNITSFS